MADFLQTVQERVVIYDGAMGTNIQKRNPTLDDYWGKENCNEVLVLSRPDIIREIHADFFRVGCDVVETDTFQGSRIVLGEFDLGDRAHEINVKARATRPRSRAAILDEGSGRGLSPDRWVRPRNCRRSVTSASTPWWQRTKSRHWH